MLAYRYLVAADDVEAGSERTDLGEGCVAFEAYAEKIVDVNRCVGIEIQVIEA